MCHESPCNIKNNVPHIYRRYSVKKFSRLVSSKSAESRSSPVKAEICYCNCSCTDNFALHRRKSLKLIPQTLKTSILKISSQNIFCICVEHYSWCDRVIRDTWHTLLVIHYYGSCIWNLNLKGRVMRADI